MKPPAPPSTQVPAATSTTPIRLTDRQRLDWLRLIRSDNVGPATFRSLINHFGSAAAALDALPGMMRRAARPLRVCSADAAARELEALDAMGGRLVALGEEGYPPLLCHIDGPPPLLSVLGAPAIAAARAVAIVGARDASAAGRTMAAKLAADLGSAHYAVVSGLARGVDTAAHRAAVSTGTIAVLAGGLDRIYPEENSPLLRAIVDNGGLAVSEMPLGWEPRARDFPRRNRLISGISLGVIVIEAALRSGSLITARLAAEQGREVMAVPGSPLDRRTEGSNRLLKDGAALICTVDDILQALGTTASRRPPDLFAEDDNPLFTPPGRDHPATGSENGPSATLSDATRARIMEALGPTPSAVDMIAALTGEPVRTVTAVLLELDVCGRLDRHRDGSVSLVP